MICKLCNLTLRNLLMIVGQNGMAAFKGKMLKESFKNYDDLGLDNDILKKRFEWLCEFFKVYLENKSLRKRRPADRSMSTVRKSKKKAIERDQNGNIIYPIQVSASMKILAPGKLF